MMKKVIYEFLRTIQKFYCKSTLEMFAATTAVLKREKSI